MLDARIDKIELRRTDIRFPFPPQFASRLKGRRIVALARRAKYLLFQLDGEETLIAHLGMSGSFRIEAATTAIPGSFHRERGKDPKHDHVVLHLDNGSIVTYNDPRRFGFMDLVANKALNSYPRLRGLGVEPLAREFDADRLAKLFAGKRTPLKAGLLDQRRIAGLGNIYACEALFRAGLSPLRPASILSDAHGAPSRAAVQVGRGDPRGPCRGNRGGRIHSARSSPGRRRPGVFSACLCSLRSRRLAVSEAALSRRCRAHHPIRPFDFLLPDLPEIAEELSQVGLSVAKSGLPRYPLPIARPAANVYTPPILGRGRLEDTGDGRLAQR